MGGWDSAVNGVIRFKNYLYFTSFVQVEVYVLYMYVYILSTYTHILSFHLIILCL